ncbi:acid-sensing ion channel 4-A-like [Mytilus edulis]|uniref:acid-sensing ion channel 4-A-like n=1 Tax=Mytilus edulis TaxID=6550 RepID=UPI0039F006B7
MAHKRGMDQLARKSNEDIFLSRTPSVVWPSDVMRNDVTTHKNSDSNQILKHILTDIASRSTVHGISNIVSSKSIYTRLVWVLAFLACLGLVVYQLVKIFVLYASFPTQTTYKLDRHSEFPSVTVCNNGYAEYDYSYTHLVGNMLVNCKYAQVNGSCETPSSYVSSKYGTCFTFNPPDYLTKLSGLQGGITLELNLETHQQRNIEYGMRFTVHVKNTFPFPFEEGVTVSGGDVGYIAIKSRQIKRLGGDYGDCQNEKQIYGRIYTSKVCLQLCWEELLYDECSCFDPDLDSLLWQVGNIKGSNCYNKIIGEPSPCYLRARELYLSPERRNWCDCPLSCRENTYSLKLTRHQWHTGPNVGLYLDKVCEQIYKSSPFSCELASLYSDPFREAGDNFIKVVIYLQDSAREIVEEEPLYQRSQMLADIGGSLGLFIGASVLSLGEVIEVFTAIFCRKKNSQQADSN